MANNFSYSEGTLSVAQGSTTVNGVGTSWSTSVKPGDTVNARVSNEWVVVGLVSGDSPVSNLTFELQDAYLGVALVDVEYRISRGIAWLEGAQVADSLSSLLAKLGSLGLTGFSDVAGPPSNDEGREHQVHIDGNNRTYQKRAGVWVEIVPMHQSPFLGAALTPLSNWLDRGIIASQFEGDSDTIKLGKLWDAMRNEPNGAKGILDGYKDWVVEDEQDIYGSAATEEKQIELLCDRGSRLLVNFTGADKAVFKAVTDTGTRGPRIVFSDLMMRFHPDIGAGSVAPTYFEGNIIADWWLLNCDILHNRNNSIMRLNNPFNIRMSIVEMRNGGAYKFITDTQNTKWSLLLGERIINITEGPGIFNAAQHEGRRVSLHTGGGTSEMFRILKVLSTTSVRVDRRSLTNFVDARGNFEPPRASIDIGVSATTVNMSANCMWGDVDIGYQVLILDAGGSGKAHRAKISAVDAGLGSFTIDTAALESVEDAVVLFAPAVDLYNGFNDITTDQWHNIHPSGCGLSMINGSLINFDGMKFHAFNSQVESQSRSLTACHMYIEDVGVRGNIEFTGTTHLPDGQVIIRGQTRRTAKFNVGGLTTGGVPFAHERSGGMGGGVLIDDFLATKKGVYSDLDVLQSETARKDVTRTMTSEGPIIYSPYVKKEWLLPETSRLIQWMDVSPSHDRILVYNKLISGLKETGYWDKAALLYMLKAHHEQASRLNLIRPGWATLIPLSNPVFTVDQGWTFDGLNPGSCLDTGLSPEEFIKYEQNNAHHTVGVVDEGATLGEVVVSNASAVAVMAWPTNGSYTRGRINTPTTQTFGPNTIGVGNFLWNRTGPTSSNAYLNATNLGADATETVPLSEQVNSTLIGRAFGTTSSDDTVDLWGCGLGLTLTEISDSQIVIAEYQSQVGGA